jgi:hypothetical protein
VFVSGSVTGQALRAYFNERALGVFPKNRLCRGVLVLPHDHADDLRGRRRQALRTNLRKAAAAGIRCEVVSDSRRAVDDACHVLSQWNSLNATELRYWTVSPEFFARPETTVMVARDERGRPVAYAAAIIYDMVCLIGSALAICHEARWALHDHLVRLLIARRVRYLLAEGGGPFGALGFAVSVQHYQHLLGYELRHLRPVSARPMMRTRRLLEPDANLDAAGSVAR